MYQEKTAFITNWGLYCYKVKLFGLKNAGAMYQRLVNRMFKEQIGRNMKVFVDDLLVKSKKPELHIEDLREAFVGVMIIQNGSRLTRRKYEQSLR